MLPQVLAAKEDIPVRYSLPGPGDEFSIFPVISGQFLLLSLLFLLFSCLRNYLKSGSPPKPSFPRSRESTTHPAYLAADVHLQSIAGFEIASARTINTSETGHQAWQEERVIKTRLPWCQ